MTRNKYTNLLLQTVGCFISAAGIYSFAVDYWLLFCVARLVKAVTMDASIDFQVLRHSSDAFR